MQKKVSVLMTAFPGSMVPPGEKPVLDISAGAADDHAASEVKSSENPKQDTSAMVVDEEKGAMAPEKSALGPSSSIVELKLSDTPEPSVPLSPATLLVVPADLALPAFLERLPDSMADKLSSSTYKFSGLIYRLKDEGGMSRLNCADTVTFLDQHPQLSFHVGDVVTINTGEKGRVLLIGRVPPAADGDSLLTNVHAYIALSESDNPTVVVREAKHGLKALVHYDSDVDHRRAEWVTAVEKYRTELFVDRRKKSQPPRFFLCCFRDCCFDASEGPAIISRGHVALRVWQYQPHKQRPVPRLC